MNCTVKKPLSPEEKCAQAPPVAFQPFGYGPYGGMGLFRKTEEIFNGRPVYMKTSEAGSKMYLYYQEAQVAYNPDEKKFLPNGDKSKMKCWKTGPAVSEQGFGYKFSQTTESYSPHEAKFLCEGAKGLLLS